MAELAKNLPVDISIHAPHEGVRRDVLAVLPATYHFNPRTPRGGATCYVYFSRRRKHFNPRTPRGGATLNQAFKQALGLFQSTHPTRGCDFLLPSTLHRRYFNPRTPRGGATPSRSPSRKPCKFQSTHPTRGCDVTREGLEAAVAISIHAPHEGVRLC